MKRLPIETEREIIRLRREGLLYKVISRQLELPVFTVGRICRKYIPELREIAHPHILDEDIQEITRLRRKGYSYEEISEEVGCCPQTVMEYCKKYCPGLKNICHHKRLDKKIEQAACYLYESGLSIQDVMKKLRIGYKAVRNSLRRNGFVQRRGKRIIRYSNARNCML